MSKPILIAHLGISTHIDADELINEIVEPFIAWFQEHEYSPDTYTLDFSRYDDDMFYQVMEAYLIIHHKDIAAHFIMEHAGEIPVYEQWGPAKSRPSINFMGGLKRR